MNDTNEKTKFDTTQPFIAIVLNEVEGSYFTPTHGVYLVNPLERPLANVYERVGGFFSDDDGVIEAQPKTHGPYTVDARSALHLETSSDDEFDELDCWWSIAYEVEGEKRKAVFDAGKGLRSTTRVEDCPVLGRPALVVGR
jgi:hypothetical protein